MVISINTARKFYKRFTYLIINRLVLFKYIIKNIVIFIKIFKIDKK